MLDRKFIVENAEVVQQNCRNRNVEADVKRLAEMELQRREKLQQVQELNRRANEVSKSIGKAKDPEEREARKEEGRQLREQKDAAQAEHDKLDAEITAIQITIPNITHPDAPIGRDEESNAELRRGKHDPPRFDFQSLDHVELCEKLDLLDLEGGARTTGHGFYYFKNDAVLIELAFQRYALDLLLQEGFTPTITPDLARDEIISGIGFNPRGPETQIYSIENSDLSLIATAEITLGGLYAGQTLDADELPIKLCGVSHCYRTEAGAHGRAARGIYRVHQFTKIEMFAFTLPDQSDAMLDHLCDLECRLFDGLEIPYRVVDTATGDLGGPAYRKFDLEAWMPGRGESGQWGEVTSTSNCTDYQARRLNTRYKRKGEKGTRFVHTLNGTAIAVSRAMIAILENHQQADGSVVIPEALRPWVGKERIEPRM
jgi:seryl-tRNA synthetase